LVDVLDFHKNQDRTFDQSNNWSDPLSCLHNIMTAKPYRHLTHPSRQEMNLPEKKVRRRLKMKTRSEFQNTPPEKALRKSAAGGFQQRERMNL